MPIFILNFYRHLAKRFVYHFWCNIFLKIVYSFKPFFFACFLQYRTIEVDRTFAEFLYKRNMRTIITQLTGTRHKLLHGFYNLSVKLRKYLIAISRNSNIGVDIFAVITLCPAPLIFVPIPVTHKHIKNPSPNIIFLCDLIFFIFSYFFKKICGAFYILIKTEHMRTVKIIVWLLNYHIQTIAMSLIKIAQCFLFRNIKNFGVRMIKICCTC